jgi:hypothetical protein
MLKTFTTFKPQFGSVRSLHLRQRATYRPALATSVIASSAAASAPDDVQGEMLQPSVFNKPIVRFASLAAVTAAAAKARAFLPMAAAGFIHMLAFGAWFGTLAWTSFVFGESIEYFCPQTGRCIAVSLLSALSTFLYSIFCRHRCFQHITASDVWSFAVKALPQVLHIVLHRPGSALGHFALHLARRGSSPSKGSHALGRCFGFVVAQPFLG